MIQIKNLTHSFISGKSAFIALENVNLQIREGEFIAIVGPSGSGKSTILNLIGGLLKPQEGNVLINDKDITTLSDNELSLYRNQDIGFIFQEFHLESYLNVKENVILPCFFHSYDKVKEKYAEQLIAEVGLTNKIDSNVNELSGGQRQRTAIARALVNKPKIIIADEPTGNLDLTTGSEILKLLKKLHKEHNTTLIIATHDEKIAKMADRIITVTDGQIS